MNRTLWHAGVIFVAFGVMLAIVPTGSYSTIAGERTVGVSVAADDSALIALEGSMTTVTKQESAAVHLVNNIDSGVTVTYGVSFDSGSASSLTVGTSNDVVSLAPGEQHPLSVSCQKPLTGNSGTGEVRVNVDAATPSANTTVDGIVTTQVSYDCQKGGGGGTSPVAYVDSDGDGQYDDGETTLTEAELATFDDSTATLVIDADGSKVRQSSIDITAASVTIQNTDLVTTGTGDISIQATAGPIDAQGVTLDSNGGIRLHTSGTLTANRSTLASRDNIDLTSSGDISLAGATLDAKNADVTADLGTNTATLDVNGATIVDGDDTLVYSPNGITVVGTPASGRVSP
ncbi:hemagglutinin repeat-containing protein [Haloferax sp. YSMS24]|uniref:hemagglutinin repeat-containing protein n=1 Tax=Haloferax sp. YSMS24 TaxID=3388425 RepID=UPI00398CAD8E